MSDFEDGQQLQRAHGAAGVRSAAASEAGHTVAASQFHPLTPLKEVPEQEEEEAEAGEEETAGARNNNSIMGKVKRRVSSILPAALSGWFSPSSKPGAESPASLHRQQQEQQRQPNGRTKRKLGRRRIVLAEADAEADDVDDGSDARGLDYEEVALADNIAEHDLAAEDEQTRRSEYNVFLLRRQRDALAAAGGQEDDDEDDDEEDEEEECDEEDDDDEQELQQVGLMPKRRRLELLETTAVSLPHRRRLPLSSSTPAASLVAASSSPASDARNSSSQLAPHRRTHLNLYGNQRNREPAFNFFAGNEAAAEGTTGDLPHSIRRSLNIPFGGGGGSSSSSNLSISSLLPNHKRPPLLAKRTERLDRIGDCAGGDRQRDLYNLLLNMNNADNKNINNNNNNVEKVASGGGDSHSEGDLNNYQDNGEGDGLRPSSRHNSNSHLEFYGNLQSAKSLFNRNNVSAQPTLHNSTWSLNSLSKRRKFNASIYGSTSALSDSRLLSHSASGSSASASSSPFYQGRTAFGGHSANNRFFNRSSSAASSLLAINSGGSSPVHSGSGSFGYGMKPVEMRPNPSGISGSSTSGGQNCNLSSTTQRILHLLDSYSTPLIDAKRMGSTLKEHQSRRNFPAVSSPYSRPRGNDTQSSSSSISNASSAALAELRSDKLLLPSMQQLLERRRLNRVTASSRNLMLSQRQNSEAKAAAAAASSAGTTTTDSVPLAAAAPPSHSHHTNKMRSKLSHQTRGKETREEEAAPPPLDLPQISFPDMASTPKFDLVIKKTTPQAVVPASTPAPSKSNSSTSAKPNFLVNPQPLNVANGSVTGVVGKPAGRMYSFPEPTPLNPSNSPVAEPNAIRRTYFFPAPASLDAEPAMNGLPPQGFGEQFKKSGQEWECDVCMVRNKAEVGKCVACESPKPGAASNVAKVPPHMAPAAVPAVPIGAGFGDRFKKSSSAWECDACMLSNKEEATKCIACETPRKTAASASKINNFPLATNNFSSVSGFGDAFKPKPGRWECQTCLVMNDSAAVECVACQTPNPQAQTDSTEPSSNSSSSSSSSGSGSGSSSASGGSPQGVSSVSSSSFKFGFAPKQDAGFQQLVAAQKAASWDCDACMAQNDMSRHKCICCEQLKPGSSATGAATSLSSLNSSSSSSTLAAGNTVPKFSFGFAPVQKATTTEQPTKGGFTFGASKGEPAPEQTKEETKETKATSTTEATAPAPVSAPAPALTQPFVFRAPTTSSTASSSTATTTTTSTPALAGFSFGAPSSSSTVSSSTANSVDAALPAAKPMFSFSGTSAVSSTSSQQPAAKAETLSFGVSSNTITTTTSSTGFALAPAATPVGVQAAALSFAATSAPAQAPAAAPAPATAPAPAPAAANFSFGSQAAKTVSTPVAAGNFFFGQPPAAALGTVNTSVSSIFGASAVSTSTSTAASSATNSTVVSSAPAAVATSNPLLFSFGGAEKKAETTPAPSAAAKPFLFGSAAGTTTTTPMPSFGWPSNGASAVTSTAAAVSSSQGIMMAEQPIFASSAMFAAPSSTSSSLFGSTATTAAATPAAVSLGGNGGGLATVFGNVGNSLVAPVATAAATPAAIPAPAAPSPLANIFGNPTPIAAAAPSNVFGSAGGGFGGAAATTTATTKPAFNFSGSAAVAATPSGSPFNFGSSTAAPAKPTFNFTGSVTAATPQAGAFTFSANPSSTPLTAGDTAQPSPQRIFRFGAPSDGGAAADMGAVAGAGPGGAASSTSSSASFAGGAPPMFNFNAATPQMQMQSTPNANAPFQFSAGAPAPANIFAFNQPAGQSAQNSQVRRKVRTPMRRLPPR